MFAQTCSPYLGLLWPRVLQTCCTNLQICNSLVVFAILEFVDLGEYMAYNFVYTHLQIPTLADPQ